MLSRFRKEVAAIELYGKLPIAKDYLRVGGGNGAGIALRDWVDQGFSTLGDRAAPPTLAWPGRFIIGQYPGDPLMGCSWPSSDSGGLRPFPFTTFMARRKKALAADWAAGGTALRPLWDQLMGVYTAHSSFGDGQGFLAAMRGKEIQVASAVAQERERVDFDLWVKTIWPDGGVDELVHLLVALTRLAQMRWAGPVRLPLVAGLPSIPQVHAWWGALAELHLVDRNGAPTMFFPIEGGLGPMPHFVTFLLGPLDPTQQAWLAPPTTNLGTGDHATTDLRVVHDYAPPSEATPPLSDSLRGPLITARAHTKA